MTLRVPRGLAGQHRGQRVAIGLDPAEELVVVRLARRQLQRLRDETGVGLHRDAVPVQVVAVGDRPAQLDAVARRRLGASARTLRRPAAGRLVDRRPAPRPGRRAASDSSDQANRRRAARRKASGSRSCGSVILSRVLRFRGHPVAGRRAGRRGFDRDQLRAVRRDAGPAAGRSARRAVGGGLDQQQHLVGLLDRALPAVGRVHARQLVDAGGQALFDQRVRDGRGAVGVGAGAVASRTASDDLRPATDGRAGRMPRRHRPTHRGNGMLMPRPRLIMPDHRRFAIGTTTAPLTCRRYAGVATSPRALRPGAQRGQLFDHFHQRRARTRRRVAEGEQQAQLERVFDQQRIGGGHRVQRGVGATGSSCRGRWPATRTARRPWPASRRWVTLGCLPLRRFPVARPRCAAPPRPRPVAAWDRPAWRRARRMRCCGVMRLRLPVGCTLHGNCGKKANVTISRT